jgi:molybdopterin-guanine dinucleotide biosynthesis protein A
MDRTAIVLNNSESTNLEQDKALIELNGKPLIKHVVSSVEAMVDEIIVVANSQESLVKYTEVLGPHVQIIVNNESTVLLSDALKGFEAAKNKFSLLLPSNTPFVSLDIVDLLFELCHSRSAAIPRSPDQEVELLHAVYNTKVSIEAAKLALNEGKTSLLDMVENMGSVRYVSTLVIQELDPEMKMFYKVNRSVDLKMLQTRTTNKNLKLNKKRQPH